MTDLVDQLREAALLPFATTEELLVQAADLIELQAYRIQKLEAELGATAGTLTFPDKEQRAAFRLQIQTGSVDP